MNTMGTNFLQRKVLNATSGQMLRVNRQIQNELKSMLTPFGQDCLKISDAITQGAQKNAINKMFNPKTHQIRYSKKAGAMEDLNAMELGKNATLGDIRKKGLEAVLTVIKSLGGEELLNSKGVDAVKKLLTK